MATWLASRTVERVALSAISRGGHQFRNGSIRYVEWDISGRCQTPRMVELRGRPVTVAKARVLPKEGKPMHVDLLVRCRKCDPCLHARKLLWADRARWEYAAAPRTWLLTLTNRPDVHAMQLAMARASIAKQGLDFDELPDDEQFILQSQYMGRELTKFLKRVRKTGAPFRYLAVTEKHKNGLPHLHVLLNEQDMGRPLRKAMLQGKWPHGYSNCKLVEDVRQVVYVTKYLSKAAAARVRASLRYGNTTSGDSPKDVKNSTPEADSAIGTEQHSVEGGDQYGISRQKFAPARPTRLSGKSERLGASAPAQAPRANRPTPGSSGETPVTRDVYATKIPTASSRQTVDLERRVERSSGSGQERPKNE